LSIKSVPGGILGSTHGGRRVKRVADVSEVLRANSARAEELCAKVNGEKMCQRPAAERWSTAECLAHLAISAKVYEPIWREAYAVAKRGGDTGAEPYHMDFIGRLLNWTLEPGRFKFSAPAAFRPVEVASGEQALAGFLASQNMVIELLAEGAGLPLDRMRITSPFSANVRYSVWSSFVIIATHERRHLLQAEMAGGLRSH
jgi:DinB superfamily